MRPKFKKFLKVCGIVAGAFVGVGIVGFALIGAGEVFCEQYHDPDNWPHSVYQYARYGWSLKLNDGWAA